MPGDLHFDCLSWVKIGKTAAAVLPMLRCMAARQAGVAVRMTR